VERVFRSFKVALLYIRVTTHPEALYLRMYPAMPIGQLHEPTTRRRWCPSKRLGLMESRWDRFQGVTAKRTEGSTPGFCGDGRYRGIRYRLGHHLHLTGADSERQGQFQITFAATLTIQSHAESDLAEMLPSKLTPRDTRCSDGLQP
jgi:hypothetical protein